MQLRQRKLLSPQLQYSFCTIRSTVFRYSHINILQPSSISYIRRRAYATPIDTGSSSHVWPSNPNPTPYQIFNCEKGDVYSKRKYYELCMLYHPDRCCKEEHVHTLSDKIRNDRFRLVVAANEILSDPMKKRAYDHYGVGWNREGIQHGRIPREHTYYRHATNSNTPQHSWWTREAWTQREGHEEPPDPHNNATWEDWEKYYAWKDGNAHAQYTQPQKPLYTSNVTFISILVCLVSVGSILSINHAQKSGQMYIADQEKVHEQIWKDVERRRREARELGHKDERVRNFLRNRDPVGTRNGEELARGKYSRLLPAEQGVVDSEAPRLPSPEGHNPGEGKGSIEGGCN